MAWRCDESRHPVRTGRSTRQVDMLPRMASRGEWRTVHCGAPSTIRALSKRHSSCYRLGGDASCPWSYPATSARTRVTADATSSGRDSEARSGRSLLIHVAWPDASNCWWNSVRSLVSLRGAIRINSRYRSAAARKSVVCVWPPSRSNIRTALPVAQHSESIETLSLVTMNDSETASIPRYGFESSSADQR